MHEPVDPSPAGLARSPASWLLVTVALVALTACTHAVPLKATLEPPPAVVPLPLVVGVFYAPELRSYQHVGSRMGDNFAFPLGQASVPLLDRAVAVLFESAVPVTGRPPLAGGPAVAGVIEPKIEAFDFSLPFLKTGTYTAEITYRFTLYAPDGVSVASWLVRGTGAKPGQVGFEFGRWPGEAADLALQDAVRQFVAGFRDIPEVRRWLRERGVRDTRRAPAWWDRRIGRA